MIRRLILAAALALAPIAAVAQQTQWPGVSLYDFRGTPFGTAGNPVGMTAASSGAQVGPAPTSTTTSALVAKSSPGNLYGYNATAAATAGFVAILNAAAVPSAGAAITPLECSAVASNGTYRTRQDIPDRYGTGIVLVFTSSCSTYTAVTPAVMAAVVQ